LPLQVPDALGARNYDILGQVQKEAVLHDAGPGRQLSGQAIQVGDGAEPAIQDHVALIGAKLVAIR